MGYELCMKYKHHYISFTDAIWKRSNDLQFLLSLASSETAADYQVWTKLWPDVVAKLFEQCPTVVHSALSTISERFSVLQPSVAAAADPSRNQNSTLTAKWTYRTVMPALNEQIE